MKFDMVSADSFSAIFLWNVKDMKDTFDTSFKISQMKDTI